VDRSSWAEMAWEGEEGPAVAVQRGGGVGFCGKKKPAHIFKVAALGQRQRRVQPSEG
jgi:hypothetical protein